MKKILVLYVFHIFNRRVNYFINNAIIEDDNVDYIIICNNKNIRLNSLPSYVKTLYRNNRIEELIKAMFIIHHHLFEL
jgi:hypothetical protein